MIVTVTLNAAIDRTLVVPNFQPGQRHRASVGFPSAGGKGINVARALKRLGAPVVCTGLAGGRTGTLLVEGLTNEGMLNDFVRIHGESPTAGRPRQSPSSPRPRPPTRRSTSGAPR